MRPSRSRQFLREKCAEVDHESPGQEGRLEFFVQDRSMDELGGRVLVGEPEVGRDPGQVQIHLCPEILLVRAAEIHESFVC
jgi:hypothetical protein